MSPERMEGMSYTFAGDIWSLGIMIIETITGVFPYKEKNSFQLYLEISDAEAPSLPDNEHYSPELKDFLS